MWRIGRARPMPAGVLADAEMIDPSALPEVEELQAQVHNDGEALLNELQTMDDSPMAEKPVEALELWLIAEGYIAQGQTMKEADVRRRLIELASPSIRSGEITPDDIDRMISQMPLW